MFESMMFGYESASSEAARQMSSQAATDSRRADSKVRDIEDRFERLSLVCMAMWSLLQDKTDLTERDLMDRVKVIDLMDGQADGKASKVGVTKCGSCDRAMSARHIRCIYCGSERPAGSAFDRV